jgi:hypothetical protein
MAKLVLSMALLLSLLAVSATAEKFDFFYFVQQVTYAHSTYVLLTA